VASITTESNGNRTIQFVGKDGKRRSVRLGNVTLRAAETVKTHVERLVNADAGGYAVEPETAAWLATIADTLHDRLVRVGLARTRGSSSPVAMTLGQWLDTYKASRDDVKASTKITFGNADRHLREIFGADKPLADILPGDADEWRRALKREGLAENTIRRRTGIARQIFRAAIRKRIITENPFDGLPVGVRGNAARDRFITPDEATAILEACPDDEWKLIFALSRYGGLRCPSEHMALKWADVDWDKGRLTIRSPKLEHHGDKASRRVPLFPELRSHLLAVFEAAEDGAEYVITRYRDPKQNLRTQFQRIIHRAGLSPWPKLFHNLRASRETELMRRFPAHVVVEWIGHSLTIAREHYLQTTDEDWKSAIEDPAEKAVQNPVQQAHASARKPSHNEPGNRENRRKIEDLRDNAALCEVLTGVGMGDEGLEPPTPSV